MARAVEFPRHKQSPIIGAPEQTPQQQYLAHLKQVYATGGLQAACEAHADQMTLQVGQLLNRAWAVSLWSYEQTLSDAVPEVARMMQDISFVTAVGHGGCDHNDLAVLRAAFGKLLDLLDSCRVKAINRAEIEYPATCSRFDDMLDPVRDAIRELR